MDLTQDYSIDALAMAKAGGDAIMLKGKELGLTEGDLVTEYIIASMKQFSRAMAAAYVAAHNRESIEEAMHSIMEATEQRIIAEIVEVQIKKGMQSA